MAHRDEKHLFRRIGALLALTGAVLTFIVPAIFSSEPTSLDATASQQSFAFFQVIGVLIGLLGAGFHLTGIRNDRNISNDPRGTNAGPILLEALVVYGLIYAIAFVISLFL